MYNSSSKSLAQSPSNQQASQFDPQTGFQPRIMDRKDFVEGRDLSKQYFNRMNRESNMDLFSPTHSQPQQDAFLKKNLEYATFVKPPQVDKSSKAFKLSQNNSNLSMDDKYRLQMEKGLMQFAGHYGSPG